LLPDPYSLNINGQKVVLSHGDFLCTDDVDYIAFRDQVRAEEWQINFLKKDLTERKEIADAMRGASQEATAEKSNTITDVNALAVESFIDEHKPSLFIHGHTHRPDIHDVNSSKRVVLGDWNTHGWFLSIDENDHKLEKFLIS
jgi:UDP-2,3-diacylglucosamine hydrolase